MTVPPSTAPCGRRRLRRVVLVTTPLLLLSPALTRAADAEPSAVDLAAPLVSQTVTDPRGDVQSYLGRPRRDDAALRRGIDLRSVMVTSDRSADLLSIAVTTTDTAPPVGRRMRQLLMVVGFAPDQVAFQLLAHLRTGVVSVVPMDDTGAPSTSDCAEAALTRVAATVTLTVPYACLLGAESAVLAASTIGQHDRRPRIRTSLYSDDAAPSREIPLTHLDAS